MNSIGRLLGRALRRPDSPSGEDGQRFTPYRPATILPAETSFRANPGGAADLLDAAGRRLRCDGLP
jgi:hypothetical protein